MRRWSVFVVLIVPATMHAGDKKTPKPATNEQNSYMLGRIVYGIERRVAV